MNVADDEQDRTRRLWMHPETDNTDVFVCVRNETVRQPLSTNILLGGKPVECLLPFITGMQQKLKDQDVILAVWTAIRVAMVGVLKRTLFSRAL